MMPSSQTQRKLATATTISSFFIAGITGLLIFFEFAPGSIRAVHEWMSIVFLFGASAHIFVNVKMFKRYFTHSKPLMAGIVIMAGIVLISSINDLYVAEQAYQLLLNTELKNILIMQGMPYEQVSTWSQHNGIKIEMLGHTVLDHTILEIADLNNMETHHVLETLLAWKGR